LGSEISKYAIISKPLTVVGSEIITNSYFDANIFRFSDNEFLYQNDDKNINIKSL